MSPAAAGTVAQAPVITVNGSPLAERVQDHIIALRIHRGFDLIARGELRINDPGYETSTSLHDSFAVGAEVKISLFDQEDPLLVGTVTGVSLDSSIERGPELTVIIDDRAYRLTRGSKVTTYLNQTYADIITSLATACGLTAKITKKSTIRPPYTLQASNDLEFLNDAVRRTGHVWWVDGSDTLNVLPANTNEGAVTLRLGAELESFSVRTSGLQPTESTVTGWDPKSQRNLAEKSRPATAPGSPSTLARSYAAATSVKKLHPAPSAAADQGPADAEEARELAASLFSDDTAAAVIAQGKTLHADARMKPSVLVTIEDAGPSNGDYLVNEVEHVYSRRGFITRFVAGPHRPTHLVDTLSPPPPNPGFVLQGLVIGTVTNLKDEEKKGRVKVRYAGLNGEIESPWARLLMPGAGKKRGMLLPPEVGDEVLLGFEHGDPRRPLVLGGLYSAKNPAPTPSLDPGQKQVEFRTLTSRLGHVVEIADGQDPEHKHIRLELASGHKIRLGEDRFDITMASGKPLTIAAGSAKFDVDASGNISIAGNNITIEAKQALTLKGQTRATMEGTQEAAVKGMKVGVTGSMNADVSGGTALTLKGAKVAIN